MLSQTALHSMLSGAKAKGLGETLHVAQVYTTRGGWKGQADHHLRESNLKRVIKALPGGEALVTCHELEISLANQLGFKEQKRDDWGVANVVFNTEQARDTFIKGEGFSQDTTCKKALCVCDQTVYNKEREREEVITGNEVEVCIYKCGDIEKTPLFVKKGLKVGKPDGKDYLQTYFPLRMCLDPQNPQVQALTRDLFAAQMEGVCGKPVTIDNMRYVECDDSIPTRVTARVGCEEFGDMLAFVHLPYSADELTRVPVSWSHLGDKHRCWRNGMDGVICTDKHVATDECRRPPRRGGLSGNARRKQREERENAGAANAGGAAPMAVDAAAAHKRARPAGPEGSES